MEGSVLLHLTVPMWTSVSLVWGIVKAETTLGFPFAGGMILPLLVGAELENVRHSVRLDVFLGTPQLKPKHLWNLWFLMDKT